MKLLAEVNQQLDVKGVNVKESQGSILDVRVITSAARPKKELKTIAVDRQEEVTHIVQEDNGFLKTRMPRG